jgi:hypothetical protein
MVSTALRGNILLVAFGSLWAFGLGAGQAEAQWGMGGMGFGFYGGGLVPQIPQPVTFLNQVALSEMSHVRGPTQNNVYAGNPNSYINHLRDNGFVDQYSAYRRQPSYYPAPPAQAQRLTPTAMTVARSKPVVPLASFYDAQNQLVWPSDAPTADSLKDKRATTDQATRAVLDETRKNGVASVAAVTEARQKLLDYGRPALHYVRTHETPRLADTFHVFLLELYDSLAQAVYPTGTATAGTPASAPSS